MEDNSWDSVWESLRNQTAILQKNAMFDDTGTVISPDFPRSWLENPG